LGKYIEYEGPFRELYNLKTDPYELTNSYDATAPPDCAYRQVPLLYVSA
jgi:hypothetical protein